MTLAMVKQVGVIFLLSTMGCVAMGGPLIRWLVRARWLQPARYKDCPPLQAYQQRTKQGIPTMGGLLVLGVALAVAVLGGGMQSREGWLLVFVVVSMAAVGLVDDVLKLRHPNAKGLRCRPKLGAALIIGGLLGWALAHPSLGYRQAVVPWTGMRWDVGWGWVPLAMMVIAGCAHAVNLTDGMDGLAAGCLAVAFGALALVALADPARYQIAVWCGSLAGACAGFLWFNSFPASVFLGDVGALGLGAALGALALFLNAAFVLMIIGGIFVAEALSVMVQVASYRWRNKRRVFRVAPLHHHFHLGGLSEQKLVVRFWILGAVLAVLGLTTLARS